MFKVIVGFFRAGTGLLLEGVDVELAGAGRIDFLGWRQQLGFFGIDGNQQGFVAVDEVAAHLVEALDFGDGDTVANSNARQRVFVRHHVPMERSQHARLFLVGRERRGVGRQWQAVAARC